MNTGEKVRMEVERLILQGHYHPGQRLTEQELANSLSVSRAPVREALLALSRDGLLDFIPNRGAVIKKADKSEIKSLFDIRIALSSLIAQSVIDAIRNVDIADLRSQIDEMERLSQGNTVDLYLEANIRFHATIYDISSLKRVADLDCKIGKELQIFRRRGLMSGGGLRESNVEHRRIVDALEERDSDRFSHELVSHITAGRDRFLRAFSEDDAATVDQKRARA